MLTVKPIPAFQDNYIWLITRQDNQYCIAVDPGDATPLVKYLQEHYLIPCAIFITHHHRDHSGGIKLLASLYPDIPIYGSANEELAGINVSIGEPETITVPEMQLTFRVIDIPGHTRGHIAYYGHQMLFCGDTLFAAGCGRVFEGTAAQMLASLTKLKALPEDTQIYCGHEYTVKNLQFAQAVEPDSEDIQQRYIHTLTLRQQGRPTLPTDIKIEKQTNPFLRTDCLPVQQAAQQYTGQALNTEVEVFAAIRSWKDQF